MGTKRTPIRRKRTAEIDAWRGVFTHEFDFFYHLANVGLKHPINVWPPEAREVAYREYMKLARVAWQKHGATFMAQWQPTASRNVPWALEQFGAPDGY